MKYHISNGEAKPCTASIRDCPVGGEHYNTPQEAYASIYKDKTVPPIVTKNKSFLSEHKKETIIAAGLATAAVATLTLANIGSLQHTPAQLSDTNNTPYSVSTTVANSGTTNFTGYVVAPNLSHSNFSQCVRNAQQDHSTITCKNRMENLLLREYLIREQALILQLQELA